MRMHNPNQTSINQLIKSGLIHFISRILINDCWLIYLSLAGLIRQTDRNLSLPQQSFMPVFINQIKLHCSFSSIWLLLPSLAASNYLIQFNFQIKPDCSLIEIEWINLIAAMKYEMRRLMNGFEINRRNEIRMRLKRLANNSEMNWMSGMELAKKEWI